MELWVVLSNVELDLWSVSRLEGEEFPCGSSPRRSSKLTVDKHTALLRSVHGTQPTI